MNTETAAQIRAEYKRLGWNARQISVRARHGCAVDVTIKDVRIPYAQAKRIAESHENIHRCSITHEILGGGNTFVSVNQSKERKEILARRYLQQVEDAATKANGTSLERVDGTAFLAGGGTWPDTFKLWHDGRAHSHGMDYTKADYGYLAAAVAMALQDDDQKGG